MTHCFFYKIKFAKVTHILKVILLRHNPLTEDQTKIAAFMMSCCVDKCETGGPMTH